MLPFEFSRRAARDLKAARLWYDGINLELGARFVDEIEDAVRQARERPTSFPKAEGGYRVARCARFPYHIYLEITKTKLRVVAVYHAARNPSLWNDPNRD